MMIDPEEVRDRAGLVPDRADRTYSRMIARDGSIWTSVDTGFRMVWQSTNDFCDRHGIGNSNGVIHGRDSGGIEVL